MLLISLLVPALAAVLLAGCGRPSIKDYKQSALEIHSSTCEELSLVMNDLSETDITDDQEWIAFLESNFEKGLEVVKANYVKLQALEVPSRAEEVQAEFLDLYKETIDVFEGLLDSLKNLDLNNQASLDQFLQGMPGLQEVGEKGSELTSKIEALQE